VIEVNVGRWETGDRKPMMYKNYKTQRFPKKAPINNTPMTIKFKKPDQTPNAELI
jgi:hypothetical protein